MKPEAFPQVSGFFCFQGRESNRVNSSVETIGALSGFGAAQWPQPEAQSAFVFEAQRQARRSHQPAASARQASAISVCQSQPFNEHVLSQPYKGGMRLPIAYVAQAATYARLVM